MPPFQTTATEQVHPLVPVAGPSSLFPFKGWNCGYLREQKFQSSFGTFGAQLLVF